MKLKKLIENLKYEKLINFEDAEIMGISYNSKTTKAGDIFVCLVGENTDGHNYYESAIDNGARAFVVERELPCAMPQIVVKSTRHQIADVADTFYNSPSKDINLIGVTGTNGKTTVTHLVQKIMEAEGEKCALIGTLGYKLSSDDTYKDAKHTTPQAPELQATLNKIVREEKIKNVAMEVSSHALEQNRVGGCIFNGAVLTNLTQDHLDYHITMDKYFDAKAILFKGLKKGDFAVINADDKYAQRFIDVIPDGVKIFTYGVKNNADVIAKDVKFSLDGATFTCKTKDSENPVTLHMNGMFSVYNVLAALTVAVASGIDLKLSIKALESTKGVAGRFEIVVKKPLVIVDYAHTPDGLENVLKAAREITPKTSQLICLFGCGGDRDATKRPKMGAIAENLADKIVITSDNPRSEEPQQIITDILAGLKSINTQRVFVEPDRRKGIEMLKTLANNEDVIVIAGKGHENYQILKEKTIHFDDREEAERVFG
ncbi:UDP-N-acetylmuramoyl-L-alanyl-D-glutamate--2,6-diaminopimelate ligase [bacterium]|nr:UDP-N-acetylmuramoyl-L-alanyl-D-glutamate--2,6-diaminopimelate ligase [bacterium]